MIVVVAVAVAVLLGGGVVVGTVGRFAADQGTSPGDGPSGDGPPGGATDGSPGAGETYTGRADPTPVATTVLPLRVGFDLHPVGPIDPDELPVVSYAGQLEIVPFPTAFDRSLRFTAPAGELCLAAPGPRAAWRIGLDVRVDGDPAEGRLHIGFGPTDSAAGTAVAFDLVGTAALEPATWYSLSISRADGGAHVEVAPREAGGRSEILELGQAGTGIPPFEEACLAVVLDDGGAAVLVDNLRIDR